MPMVIKMRVLFIVCTTLTFLQIITFENVNGSPLGESVGTSTRMGNGRQTPPLSSTTTTTTNIKTMNQIPRAISSSRATAVTDNNNNNNNNNNVNMGMTKTLGDSGKNLINTVKNESIKRMTNMVDGVTGVVTLGSDALGGVGKLLREQSKNVRLVGDDGLQMWSRLNESKTNGLRRLMGSFGRISREQAKILSDMLNQMTDATVNVSNLGKTIVVTPISMTKDAAAVANTVAQIPKKISSSLSNKIVNTMKPFVGTDDDNADTNGTQLNQANSPSPPPPSPNPRK